MTESESTISGQSTTTSGQSRRSSQSGGSLSPSPPSSPSLRAIKYSNERILEHKGYKIFHKIGEGSYSKIYKAEYIDKRIDTKPITLACKVIREKYVSTQFIEKFLKRAAEILSLINHPNIIRVHSLLTRKQTYYIFTEYAANGDLLELLRKSGAIREPHARVWFKQILAGLKFLHDSNIAHRDIKCENILFTKTYNIKITDLDFARFTVNNDQENILSTTYCGSPSYTPPEIIRGEPYDPKPADIWSLGIVLYVMLNHSMPFDDRDMQKLHENQMSKNWTLRSSIKALLSKDVQDLLIRLLEPDPKLRMTVLTLENDNWITKLPQRRSPSLVSDTVRKRTRVSINASKVRIQLPTKEALLASTVNTSEIGMKSSPSVKINQSASVMVATRVQAKSMAAIHKSQPSDGATATPIAISKSRSVHVTVENKGEKPSPYSIMNDVTSKHSIQKIEMGVKTADENASPYPGKRSVSYGAVATVSPSSNRLKNSQSQATAQKNKASPQVTQSRTQVPVPVTQSRTQVPVTPSRTQVRKKSANNPGASKK